MHSSLDSGRREESAAAEAQAPAPVLGRQTPAPSGLTDGCLRHAEELGRLLSAEELVGIPSTENLKLLFESL